MDAAQPYHSIYKKLLKVIPNLIERIKAGATWGKSKLDSPGMMDLNFDYLGKDENGSYIIALSHYYQQNGDSIADPDMQIRVLPDLEMAEALTYQDTYIFQQVYHQQKGAEQVDIKLKKSLNSFLNIWLSNLIQQGHRIDLSVSDTPDQIDEALSVESSASDISINETEGTKNEPGQDPLANEHGVYTKESAGENLERIEIQFPKSLKLTASIDVVQATSGEFKFGVRAERSFGGFSGFSISPSVLDGGYATRRAALKAALLSITERLDADINQWNRGDALEWKTLVLDAIKRFAASEEIQMDESGESLKPDMVPDPRPKKEVNIDLGHALWTDKDNSYPVNKIIIRGVAYHQSRLRQFLLDKLAGLPFTEQTAIVEKLGKRFKERAPLDSYSRAHGSFGKTEKDKRIFYIRSYVDDIIIDNDLRQETSHVLNFLMELLNVETRSVDPDEVYKEPWEMTRTEFLSHVQKYIEKFKEYPIEIVEMLDNIVRLFPKTDWVLRDQPSVDSVESIAEIAHLLQITKAMVRGQKLPAKVNKEYPWLDNIKSERIKKRHDWKEYGFEPTRFESSDSFKKLLDLVGVPAKWKECKILDKRNFGTPLYLWESEDISIITMSNPLVNNGNASLINIEGSILKVTQAVTYIEEVTGSKGIEGLKYINYENMLCMDPDGTDEGTSGIGPSPDISPETTSLPEKNNSAQPVGESSKINHLKKFSEFLSLHKIIDGNTEDGAVKETFGRLGKKAFKELADYLHLNPYDVAFNKGGVAVSGDLRLMGMVSQEKGIYISFNKDGDLGVLYRAIEHMKDFSGGDNYYFPESLFDNPEAIKEQIYNLLGIDTKNSSSTQEVPANFSAEQIIELYRKIEKGEQIFRLPELIEYLNSPQFKVYNKSLKLNLYDLISSAGFRNNITTNLWNLIPDHHKVIKGIKVIDWEANPGDKGLRTLTVNFVEESGYRPNLSGANFDGQGITATDGSILLFLNRTNPKKRGIYCVTKKCFKAVGKEDQSEAIINEKFPDYIAVLPKQINKIHSVSIDVLRRYCQPMVKLKLGSGGHNLGAFCYDKNKFIALNVEYLKIAADTFSLLGYDAVDVGFVDYKTPLLLTPPKQIDEVSKLSAPFILLAPGLLGSYGEAYVPERGVQYFNFEDSTVNTEGIEEKIFLDDEAPGAVTPSQTSGNDDHSGDEYLDRIVAIMHEKYAKDERPTKKQIEQIAHQAGVRNTGKMWEAAELSWLLWYKKLYKESRFFARVIFTMTRFWNNVQPTYDYSDSSKERYKQYSTPGPISAIVAQYTGMDKAKSVFDPSAGNGLLVLGADPLKTHVNEIDPTRLASLRFQGFSKITSYNAAHPFPDECTEAYDVVVTNPPFARWEEVQFDKDLFIRKYFDNHIGLSQHLRLEHFMSGLALYCMKENGKAAIIIMGHLYFGGDGHIAKYRPFFNWLYRHYVVDDVININGFKLYNKQGTIEKTMLILVAGRKESPEGISPKKSQAPQLEEVVDTFDELWDRVSSHIYNPLDSIIKQLKLALAA